MNFIHLDEEPDVKLYEECLMRTLDVSGNIILTMTPLKGMTDVCLHFLNSENDVRKNVIQATWDDATHLKIDEKNILRKSLRPHELEAREKGIPSLGAGKVFPIMEASVVVDPFKIPDEYVQVFGMEVGWTNPTAVVWLAYDKELDIVYLVDSYIQNESTPAEHTVHIQNRGKWIPGVCDPAGGGASQSDGTSIIDRYAEHGLYLTKANNSVEAGLMEMLERMQNGRFKVFSNQASWLQEFRLYRRDESGRIVKKHDHLMDATRYALVSGLLLAKTKKFMADSKKLMRNTNWRSI
jgi:phage terminase large subunit-like protein